VGAPDELERRRAPGPGRPKGRERVLAEAEASAILATHGREARARRALAAALATHRARWLEPSGPLPRETYYAALRFVLGRDIRRILRVVDLPRPHPRQARLQIALF